MKRKVGSIVLTLMGAFLLFEACSILPRSWRRSNEFALTDLESDQPLKKIRAARFFANEGRKEALPKLVVLLEDEDPSVRQQAHWAISKITGMDRPDVSSPVFQSWETEEGRRPASEAWKKWSDSHPYGGAGP